ncbi:IS3 family transposase [Micromonospora maritima]|uniref:IS3 family transposase n=1 Tax=Micromonospora maritima TaxID=986711 RepID=UPI0037985215
MTLVDELRARFGVAPVLRVLNVAVSTYYGWLAQAANPSARRRADAELAVEIAEIHGVSGGTYGSPRVHAMLRRQGRHVGRKQVERLMRDAGLQGAFLRKKWRIPSTRSNPKATPAPDLVNRQFTAAAPNPLWVADATRIPCGQGVFWLAAVRDVFSNPIVGWRCSDRCDTDLILGALEYGIWSRDVRDGQLIHHSDRGSNGEFKWSSQHLDQGVRHGKTCGLGDGGDGSPGDAVAGSAGRERASGGAATVLAADR